MHHETDRAPTPARAPWARPPAAVAAELEVDPAQGLADDEAVRRRSLWGPNQLRAIRRRGPWRILLDQFASLIVLLLGAAAAVAFWFEEPLEGIAILVVIVLNAGIGFLTERHALRSMEALRALGRTTTNVRRGGRVRSVPAEELVPGDLVVLDAGDVLTADLRILEGSRLAADESALTGESLPVEKDAQAVAESAALSERTPMLYKGTALTRGAGTGVVVATGMQTELGRISALVQSAEQERTPLERHLARLGRRLIVLTLAIAAVVTTAFTMSGRELYLAIEIGIALAVATFPEGLPIVATIALSRGMWRMAQRRALVERLSAVETLGATTVILTDKTGTLTENRMTAVEIVGARGRVDVGGGALEREGELRVDGQRIAPNERSDVEAIVRAAVLCNNAALVVEASELRASGDPTEVALLVLGVKVGVDRPELLERYPELREWAFDPETQRMATLHRDGARCIALAKGAPEGLIDACRQELGPSGVRALDEQSRERWRAAVEEAGSRGRRVLALAEGDFAQADDFRFEDLTLLGLVGLFDPPREDVADAIAACKRAGIRIVMVTGDHGATGANVAAAVGLTEAGSTPEYVDGRTLPPLSQLHPEEERALLAARVLARVTPEQKLALIDLHQKNGEVVAMTGDGVNDAPALEEADIGVAMGRRGTQVAREAADLVLEDDAFSSIVAAIEEGRAIFGNIRKFVVYLLACNVSELFTVGLGALTALPVPLLPLQILFLNLVTDVFPALALGVCEGHPDLMRQPPRDPREPVLTRRHWRRIAAEGALIAAAVLGSLWIAARGIGLEPRQATTVAFLTLAMAQLWHVFGMRDRGSSWWNNEVTRNRWVWAALGLCSLLLALALWVPPIAEVLSVVDPGPHGLLLALGMSLLPAVPVGLARGLGPRRG